MKYLLDTDHLSFFQRRKGAEYQRIKARMDLHEEKDVGVSIVSFHEQTIGCHSYINRAKNIEGIQKGYELLSRVLIGFTTMSVVPFDASSGSLYSELMSRNLRVAAMDLRIASIALSRGLILLTRNLRDFGKISELVTENWLI